MFVVKEICIDKNTEIVEQKTLYAEPMNRDNCVRKTVDFLNHEYNTKNLKAEEFYIVGLSPEYQIKYVLPMKGEEHKVDVSIFQFFCFFWKTKSKYIIIRMGYVNQVMKMLKPCFNLKIFANNLIVFCMKTWLLLMTDIMK